MSEMSTLEAVLLGALQGVTEFLPVSSSGHLAIGQRLVDLKPDSAEMLLFDVLTHVGTLLAVIIVFARKFRRFTGRLGRELRADWPHQRTAWRIVLLGIVASVPTALIGVVFQSPFEAAFDKPSWIGGDLIVTAILLALTLFVGRGRRGWKSFGLLAALLVGASQGLSILPGISRSGATICTAQFLGLRRRWAAQFSFLIAVPAIIGATGLKLWDTWRVPSEGLGEMPWEGLLTGAAVSLVVGVFSLLALLGVVHRAKLHWFAPYCAALGILLLAGVLAS